MKKSHKKKSRAGVLFVTGCWIILILIGIGYLTSDKKTTRIENAPAAPNTAQVATEKKGLKPRDLTDNDRKIIGECARHIKTLKNMFLEFRHTETFQEFGFSHPDYKEWQNTLEKIQQVLLKPHDEGYVIFEYSDVYAASFWLHSTAMDDAGDAVLGKRTPKREKNKQKYLQMIDTTLEPYLEW